MSPIEPFSIIILSGAAGGIINAIITDNGFILPREETSEKASIIIPGIIANLLMGAAAGFLYWGLTESNSISVVRSKVSDQRGGQEAAQGSGGHSRGISSFRRGRADDGKGISSANAPDRQEDAARGAARR